jgi:hypothetical protein
VGPRPKRQTVDHVHGFAMREAAVADAGSFDDVLDAILEYVDACRRPTVPAHLSARGNVVRTALARIMRTMFEEDRFERSLQRLLDGIALTWSGG